MGIMTKQKTTKRERNNSNWKITELKQKEIKTGARLSLFSPAVLIEVAAVLNATIVAATLSKLPA